MKKESLGIRFLYRTCAGRLLLKVLVQPWVSKTAFYYLNSRFSKWMIGYYIRKYNINMESYEKKEYTSFNDFFVRKRTAAAIDMADTDLISPCDGYLSVYEINSDSRFEVKNNTYSVRSILRNEKLAQAYEGGYCMIFRLAPYHYHRYIYVDSGRVLKQKKIRGVLHCVRPVACGQFPVYAENSREYAVIKTENIGTIVQMEVGALLVGRIRNRRGLNEVARGEEKGYFEFGGSTIILFTEKGGVRLKESLEKTVGTGKETQVRQGSRIGSCLRGGEC